MTVYTTQIDMLKLVADALGPDLREQMTFVGGCTTGLLITDAFTREQVRSTNDVDLIVHVMGYPAFITLQQRLTERGFQNSPPPRGETVPICAMMLGALRVDFMPDDENVLGFSNRWYRQAMETATDYTLEDELTIKLVNPVYFIATKLEAYKGRGGGDALSSRDIEDILHVTDGRHELVDEVNAASETVRQYIRDQITLLLEDNNFQYAVQSQSLGSKDRETFLFKKLETLARGRQ